MERYLQAAGVLLTAVIINLVLRKRDRELALVLTLCACTLALLAGLTYLRPVMDFLQELEELGNLDAEWMAILLKVVGIGFLGEVAALICTDAGEAAMGKALTVLSGAVVLWLSLPLFTGLLELVQQILEEL